MILENWPEELASELEKHVQFFREHPELGPEDYNLTDEAGLLRASWFDLRKPGNYLKHADRDSNTLLDYSSVEVEEMLTRACIASGRLGATSNKEKEYFTSMIAALHSLAAKDGETRSKADVLKDMKASRKFRSCRNELCKGVEEE